MISSASPKVPDADLEISGGGGGGGRGAVIQTLRPKIFFGPVWSKNKGGPWSPGSATDQNFIHYSNGQKYTVFDEEHFCKRQVVSLGL